jgi:RimJ/RimL family protein N-acetyltransferase
MRLVRPDVELLDAALAGDDSLARALGHAVVPGWVTFIEALQRTRDALAAAVGDALAAGGDAVAAAGDARWGTRFFVAGEPPELVGWGGFKGPPSDGVVELGYEIADARQGRGLATAATEAMIAEAFADETVIAVLAHTLPEWNASNRVLAKAGFRFDAEVEDRGETAWRFKLNRMPAPRAGPRGP